MSKQRIFLNVVAACVCLSGSVRATDHAPFTGEAAKGKQLPGAELRGGKEGAEKLVDLFGKIARNMQLIENLLKKQQTGSPLKTKQGEVLAQIDRLIEELKKRQQQAQGGGSGGSGAQQASSKQQEDQKASKKRRSGGKSPGRRPPPGSGKKRTGGQGKVPNVKRAKENPPPAQVKGPLRGARGWGGWGFLPGEVRALLDASGRSGLPAKYAELIRLYFERLSRTGSSD